MMESVEQFLARGGKIQVVDPSGTGISKDCECGCKGKPLAHAWRATVGIDDADQRMRDYENQVGVYNAYYNQ